MLKTYYYLTKPGIVYGNSLAAVAAFLLAARGHLDLILFAAMLVGLALVIASACVFNNVIDRDIDAHMARTKRRAVASGAVSPATALIYGMVLGLLGDGLLWFGTNHLAAVVAAGGWLAYVVAYGYAKRHSVYGTEVGSISGAMPPVVGYVAVSGRLDLAASLLFLILTLWQMPHFYAIAIFRASDYAAAKLPVMPLVRGVPATKRRMVAYIVAFIVAAGLLTVVGTAGWTYLLVMLVVGGLWLRRALRGFHATDDAKWARTLFGFSLIVLLTWCVMLAITAYLP